MFIARQRMDNLFPMTVSPSRDHAGHNRRLHPLASWYPTVLHPEMSSIVEPSDGTPHG